MKAFSDKSAAHESNAWAIARTALKFMTGHNSRCENTGKKLTVGAPSVSQLLKSALKAVNVHGLQ